MDNIQFIPDNQKKVPGFSDKKKSLSYLQLGLLLALILGVQIGVLQATLVFRLGEQNTVLENRLVELNQEIPEEFQSVDRLASLVVVTGSLSGQASSIGEVLASLRLETLSTVRIQRVSYVKRTATVRLTVVASSVDDLIEQEERFNGLAITRSVENSNIQSVQGTQNVTADINIILN